jgi:glycosyltransferase involved in cell wall biosynthesis
MEFPDTRLVIAGGGNLRRQLEEKIASANLGSTCRLLGHVDDIREVHNGLDLFVQASIYEGTPNAVLEAMALETPIVATAAGGTAELARDGREALIVAPRDAVALKNAIVTVLENPEGARARADAARRRVETDLSFDKRLRNIERVYDTLAERFLHRRTPQGAVSSEER